MENEMVSGVVPEVNVGDSMVPQAPPAVGGWEDMGNDIAKIAAEQGIPTPEVDPVGKPPVDPNKPQGFPQAPSSPAKAPEQPVATQAPDNVKPPEKFQGKDGALDQDKLLKSYLELEKGFKRLQQKATPAQSEAPNVAPQVPAPQPNTLEAQIAQDMISRGIDANLARAQAPTLAAVLEMAKSQGAELGYQQAQTQLQQLQEAVASEARARELRAIRESDPSIFTEEGMAQLKAIREAYPWINESPEPWKAAYQFHLGERALRNQLGSPSQVQTNPKAPTAPPGPVGAVNRNPTPPLDLTNAEQVKKYLSTLTREQEAAFWKKQNGGRF